MSCVVASVANSIETHEPSSFYGGVGSSPVAQKFLPNNPDPHLEKSSSPALVTPPLAAPSIANENLIPPSNVTIQEHPNPNDVPIEPSIIIQREENSPTAIIAIGDLLSITIKEDRSPPQVILVDEEGLVSIPYIGAVKAVGLSHKALSDLIKQKLEASYYKTATITVATAIQDGTRGQIQVTGQVNQPGTIPLPTDSIMTASGAIMRAGGATALADLTRVTIVRRDIKNTGNDSTISVNVSDVINNGRFDKDVTIKANDIISVPLKGESVGEILMSGAVNSTGVINIPIGEKYTLRKAISAAGGFTDFADKKKVKIVRQDPDTKDGQKIIFVDAGAVMDEGKLNLDQELQNDDVVIVPETWINF